MLVVVHSEVKPKRAQITYTRRQLERRLGARLEPIEVAESDPMLDPAVIGDLTSTGFQQTGPTLVWVYGPGNGAGLTALHSQADVAVKVTPAGKRARRTGLAVEKDRRASQVSCLPHA